MDFLVAIEYFYVATGLAKAKGKCVAIKLVYVATELASVGKISIATEYFYVVTELANARRNYVATKIICVMTKLAMTESSIAHDRVGRAKPSKRGSMHERRTLPTTGTQRA